MAPFGQTTTTTERLNELKIYEPATLCEWVHILAEYIGIQKNYDFFPVYYHCCALCIQTVLTFSHYFFFRHVIISSSGT